MSPTPAITGIGQIAIACHDVRRATAFYRDVVGLPFLFETTGLAFFRCGDVRLMLTRTEQAELAPPGSVLSISRPPTSTGRRRRSPLPAPRSRRCRISSPGCRTMNSG